jgi:hypothetical protein
MHQLNWALALDSTLTRAHLFRSHVFLTANQMDSSIAEMRVAQALEPFSQIVATRLMTALYFGGKTEESVRVGGQVFQADSDYTLVIPDLARAYLKAGRCTELLRMADRPMTHYYLEARALSAVSYARCGKPDQARRVLGELAARQRSGEYVGHYEFGIIYGALGDIDRAFRELNLAVDEREFFAFGIAWDPLLEYLRSDPRFSALTARIPLNNRTDT